VAIDLGTVNTLVHVAGSGVVLDEPSVMAVQRATAEVVGVGVPAAILWGRAPENVEVVRPLRDGVIADMDACSDMLGGFLRRVCRHHRLVRPKAVVCVPGCATEVERWALRRAVEEGFHFRVDLVAEPFAAALGCGADLSEGRTVLVVDIGGGTTEMGVVGGSGVVRCRSIRVGGNKMDDAIVHAVREELGLLIGGRTAERVKMALGLSGNDLESVPVTGVDPAYGGHLRAEQVSATLVQKALERSVSAILDSLGELLAEVPPDLAEDVLDRGVYLAGGGALLHGIAERVSQRACCQATVVDDPLRCVLRGLASLLHRGTRRSDAA
jgi:rod shape-determining protein MreB